jgi:hypothetical protein
VKPKPGVNVTALTAGVTSLFALVGGLTATGALGRLERNEPEVLIAAVLIVLLGSVMLVIAGLPITSGQSEIFASLVGAGLTAVGIGWAVAASITDARHSERPGLEVAVDAKGALLEGTVKAGNLAFDERFAVLVEGLKKRGAGREGDWSVSTLAQYYVGPDGEGKVELPVKVRVPPKRYTALGIRAWSGDDERCRNYPTRGGIEDFRTQVAEARAGCVVLPLPTEEQTPEPTTPAAPTKPTVGLEWIGNRVRPRSARLEVTAAGAGKRVVVLVASRRGRSTRHVLRTLNRIGKNGSYRSIIAVRVGRNVTRLCARADVLDSGERAPVRIRRCPLPKSPRIGEAGTEVSRPRQ